MKMHNEIGSEFWDVPTSDKENLLFPESTQWFLSGRSALQAIIRELHDYRTVSMPSWCCDSMVKPFVDAGIEVRFYPVYFQDRLIQEINLDSDILFVMDYFGYTSEVADMKEYDGCIIRDVTHSIFSSIYRDSDFYFGSLRKWCGVWTGGYAWAEDRHRIVMDHDDDQGYTASRERAMQLKERYINGYSEKDVNPIENKGYLKYYEAAEECLENVGIAPAAERDVSLAHTLHIDFVRERRRANAKILMEAFSDYLIFTEMKDTDCPMFVPILVPGGKRDELRRHLINNEIYCPVHWPVGKYHKFFLTDGWSDSIYENELSLVCDQRYTEKDMERIVNTAKTICF